MEETKVLLGEIETGQYDERLKAIYVDETMVPYQKERFQKGICKFEELYGAGEVEVYSAPGRSEVGGNHTDHQHGEVLAASINLDAIAVVRKMQNNVIELLSEGYEKICVDLSDLEKKEEEEGTSIGIIRGMIYGLKKNGHKIGGFQAYVTSDVLNGAGMSSSAAFETLVGTIISGLYNGMEISPVEIAQVAQYAENVFFGKPCGLMDQMACSVGGLIHIDFADLKNPMVEKVEVDFDVYHHSLCITDTKGSHADLTDDYALIPQEMKKVASFFGKEFLREVDEKEFYKNIAKLQKECGDRAVLRSLHFFEEDKRVEQEVSALKNGDFKGFLQTVKASGNSSFNYLQNVYTNKDVQNQGVSIGLAVSESILKEHGVSRVHGGGFAGTIQAFVEDSFVETYREVLDSVFGEGACHVLKVRPFGGIKVM
ncbi:galactokinase [Roseburia sp. 499]|uniref:galactokinase n=1 Tax=Roseburia sp. 499 TaxID=1261634 RepID=UPI00095256CC|nr:galactokinase family protein [Roseburia sp. 499]WVK69139.1 galactokinase family protein [Roseburia sp. 499]